MTDVNAGVHNNVGMNFQKNCTIFLFLEKYHEIRDKKYFIILEHAEDIIFGYLDENESLEKIETHQAKKSPKSWTLNSLLKIIKKITESGQYILDDPITKSINFYQENSFTTNNNIELKCQVKKKKYSTTIQETNYNVCYLDLDENIQNKILSGNKDVQFSDENKKHLNNLYFRYVDLSRNTKSQIDQLKGRFETVFGNSIIDHKAALDTFIKYLGEIESTFNQNNVAKLIDKTKKIESTQINALLNILTTKKLAFEFWRNRNDEICKLLKIPVSNKKQFKMNYLNSFDFFKDLKEAEHLKIYTFIQNNLQIQEEYFTDIDCICAYVEKFKIEKSTTFTDLQLKAIISAAYIEIKSLL